MDKKVDRRIIKTKKSIRRAFADMLRVKEFDCITVKDIADAADISRKTFYTYYQGVWAIKSEIEEEIIDLLDKDLKSADVINGCNNPQLLFVRLNSIFGGYSDFFDAVIANSDNMHLIRSMANVIEEKFQSTIKNKARELNIEERKLNLIIKYTITGIFYIYKDWYINGKKEPIENVCEDLGTLIYDGINGFSEKHIG